MSALDDARAVLEWYDATPFPEVGDAANAGISVREALAALVAECEALQSAVDRARSAMNSSIYVGGLTEIEAWRTAFDALSEVATVHVAGKVGR